jgi:two-component system chemotaxis response regulator CheB
MSPFCPSPSLSTELARETPPSRLQEWLVHVATAEQPLPVRDIVVIGASAGGVEALKKLAASLPADFPGSIFVTVHFPEHGTSMLPQILARVSRLAVVHAADGESIVRGRIYVAPPNHHLLMKGDTIELVRGPRENGNRPAVDPMFRSAALAFGPRVVGVVLTGNLDDGTSGLAAIKRAGGLALVQDPADALFSSMPQSAIDHVAVDCVAPLSTLASSLRQLVSTPISSNEHRDMADDRTENALSDVDLDTIKHHEIHPGQVSAYSCPDCGGVLWELHDGDFTRFRCRVGHAWTGDALIVQQETVLDDALWTALRALEENIALARHLSKKYHDRGRSRLAGTFDLQAEATERKAATIRRALLDNSAPDIRSETA